MGWTELKIKIPTEYTENAAAVANMTVDYGIYIEDYSDLEKGAMEIAHIDLIDDDLIKSDRKHSVIHIYFPDDANVSESAAYITENLKNSNIPFEILKDSITEEEWADNWKRFFKSTEIGKKLCIVPSWETYDNKTGRVILKIDPGAAFGTGTHDTTVMCLKLLEQYTKSSSDILDIGTGSGILSIAGVLLGARSATGVDIDKTAVKTAKENAALNSVESKTVFLTGDLNKDITGRFDIVVANIVADAIITLCESVKPLIKDDGVFICSGIIDSRESEVKNALINNGFKIVNAERSGNWTAFAAKI